MEILESLGRPAVSDRMQAADREFRLDGWTICPARCRIERGTESRRVKPKSMEVLERLMRAHGAVVSRDELFEAVWPGLAVSDDVLTNSVVELRKAFDDSARDPKVIETIPKKGFRLMADIAPVVHSAREPKRRKSSRVRKMALLLAGFAAVVGLWSMGRGVPRAPAEENSVAVLPFVDMSATQDQGYFVDGLSEELINRLTRLDGLLVTGRTSSFHFKGRDDDVRAIGRQLSVRHVLEGSVRKESGQLRIAAQLIDVESGFHLWSDSYERPYGDVFAIQDEIADAVATALSVRLSVGDMRDFVGGTTHVEAFEEFLRGSALTKEFTAETMLRAIQRLEKAVELDPGFTLAWVRLANAYRTAWLTLGNEDVERWWESADYAIGKALSLSPNEAYVLNTAAYLEVDRQNWDEAHRYFDRVLASQRPGSVHESHGYLDLLAKVGKANAAVRLKERVLLRDPLHPDTAMYLGHLYLMQGRFDDALAQFEAGMQLEGYRSQLSHEALVGALASRQPELASDWLDRVIQYQQPGAMGVHTAMRDRFGDADAALRWLREGFKAQSISDYYVIVWASYYGDYDLVLQAMRRTPDLWAFWTPLTQAVRTTPEFKQVLVDIGLVEYYRERGWNDFCRPLGESDFECR